MMIVEFITALFYEVDEQPRTIPKHPEAGVIALFPMSYAACCPGCATCALSS
jgi:hypothetical protein